MIRQAVAASLDRLIGLVPVCLELATPRSTVYAQRAPVEGAPRRKPGPKPLVPDDELLAAIREVLTDPPFMGEGYRKVHARLRYRGVYADIERVRLLMREHGLQAPGKPRRNLGPRVHDGTITTQKPDEMWGTDATSTMLLNGQQATIFGVYDHCTCELMGIHAAIEANRFEAMVPLHQACRAAFGSVGQAIAVGLKLRHDNGPSSSPKRSRLSCGSSAWTPAPPLSEPLKATAASSASGAPSRNSSSGSTPTPPSMTSTRPSRNFATSTTTTGLSNATNSALPHGFARTSLVRAPPREYT